MKKVLFPASFLLLVGIISIATVDNPTKPELPSTDTNSKGKSYNKTSSHPHFSPSEKKVNSTIDSLDKSIGEAWDILPSKDSDRMGHHGVSHSTQNAIIKITHLESVAKNEDGQRRILEFLEDCSLNGNLTDGMRVFCTYRHMEANREKGSTSLNNQLPENIIQRAEYLLALNQKPRQ